MKFEEFNGTGEAGKYVGQFDGMKQVTSSEGNRRDANEHPSSSVRYSSFDEERNAIIAEKLEVQAKLRDFSKAKLAERQSFYRRSKTWEEWDKFLTEWNKQREVLSKRILEIDRRLNVIKPRAFREINLEYRKNDPISRLERKVEKLIAEQTTELKGIIQQLIDLWKK